MRRTLASAACIVLLVIAQFGALTHSLWHALGEGSAHDNRPAQVAVFNAAHAQEDPLQDTEQPAGQAELCAFDLAFGQVLAAVNGGASIALAVAPAAISIPDVPASRLRAEVLSPKSRGPPILL